MGLVPAMSCRISSRAVSCPRVKLKSRTDLSSSQRAVLTMETPSRTPCSWLRSYKQGRIDITRHVLGCS